MATASSGSVNGEGQYTIPAARAGGCHIDVSFWHRAVNSVGSGNNVVLRYRIAAGSWVTLASISSNAVTSWAQMSGGFDNPGNNDVTISIVLSGPASVDARFIDDWSIVGTPL
ncbi:hypothetical protein [Metarhizobium album]|nr:hypothetical protein [Rhizobium album]